MKLTQHILATLACLMLMQFAQANNKCAIIYFNDNASTPVPFEVEASMPIVDVQNYLLGMNQRCLKVQKQGYTLIYPTNMISGIQPQTYEYVDPRAATVKNITAEYDETSLVVNLTWEVSTTSSRSHFIYRKKKGSSTLLYVGNTAGTTFYDANIQSNTDYEYYINSSYGYNAYNETAFSDAVAVKTGDLGVPSTMYYFSVEQTRNRATAAYCGFQTEMDKAATRAVHIYVEEDGNWREVYTFTRDYNNPNKLDTEFDLSKAAIEFVWGETYNFIALQEGVAGTQSFDEGQTYTYTHEKLVEFSTPKVYMNPIHELVVAWKGKGPEDAELTLNYGTSESYVHENKITHVQYDETCDSSYYIMKNYEANTSYYFMGMYSIGFHYGYYSDTVSYSVGALANPAQPQNFKAEFDSDSDKVTFSWDAATDVQEYEIYYGDNRSRTYYGIDGDQTSFTVYEFGTEGTSSWSLEAKLTDRYDSRSEPCVLTTEHKLHAPVNVTLENGEGIMSDNLYLRWNKVKKAEKYKVYMAREINGELGDFSVVNEASRTYYSMEVSQGKQYYFKVTAIDADGNESEFSDVRTGKYDPQPLLDAPTGLKAEYSSANKTITLTWDAVEGSAAYRIFNRSGCETCYQYKLKSVNYGNSYVIKDVEKGDTYWLSVATLNTDFEAGDACADVMVAVERDPWRSQRPTLDAYYSNFNYLNTLMFVLNWTEVEGAKYYHIYKSYEEGQLGRKIKTVTSNAEQMIDVSGDGTKTIYFTIVAENKFGQKLESNQEGHIVN